VISATPSVVGGSDGERWIGHLLRDAYGAVRRDAAGQPQRNPAHDPNRPHVPRSRRAEWAMVGLLGRLRLRPGQPTDPRWIKLRDLPAKAPDHLALEDWLLR
jgi:hypothetical protein